MDKNSTDFCLPESNVEKSVKYPLFQTEILWNITTGTHLQTTYYSDGTEERNYVPKGQILTPQRTGQISTFNGSLPTFSEDFFSLIALLYNNIKHLTSKISFFNKNKGI